MFWVGVRVAFLFFYSILFSLRAQAHYLPLDCAREYHQIDKARLFYERIEFNLTILLDRETPPSFDQILNRFLKRFYSRFQKKPFARNDQTQQMVERIIVYMHHFLTDLARKHRAVRSVTRAKNDFERGHQAEISTLDLRIIVPFASPPPEEREYIQWALAQILQGNSHRLGEAERAYKVVLDNYRSFRREAIEEIRPFL